MTLYEGVLLLLAAVILVPLMKRLGVGAVLGYLVAGVLLGPWVSGAIVDVDNIRHIAEFGVVFLLFVIGLELQPLRLWELRRAIFGYGTAQVALTGTLIALAALAFGMALPAAILIGVALSLSSTAFALQLLAERKELPTAHGRLAFSILLFQDVAAIPMIAVIPLLAVVPGDNGAPLIDSANALRAVGVIAAVVIGGRYVLRPFFRLIAGTGIQEIFTASALLVVIGTAFLVQTVGLSMALGAFLAGVILAESEYRHELEADIEPFRGLLLGLFFISVGMSVDLGLVVTQPLLVTGLVVGLLLLKAAVLLLLARASGVNRRAGINLAIYLAQGGEFAFVLFALAAGTGLFAPGLANLMAVVVSLSMAVTPLLLIVGGRFGVCGEQTPEREYDTPAGEESRVIIAGFGRFGQIVARLLRMRRIRFTALEASFEQVDFVRRYGNKIYFGDASRLELLRAARADVAEVFVLAIDDVEASLKTAALVKRHFPNLKILARARNRHHVYRLMDIGITDIWRETFLSSIDMGKEVLMELGVSVRDADHVTERFREYDEALIRRQQPIHRDEAQMVATAREAAAELERVFEQDTLVREAPAATDAR